MTTIHSPELINDNLYFHYPLFYSLVLKTHFGFGLVYLYVVYLFLVSQFVVIGTGSGLSDLGSGAPDRVGCRKLELEPAGVYN